MQMCKSVLIRERCFRLSDYKRYLFWVANYKSVPSNLLIRADGQNSLIHTTATYHPRPKHRHPSSAYNTVLINGTYSLIFRPLRSIYHMAIRVVLKKKPHTNFRMYHISVQNSLALRKDLKKNPDVGIERTLQQLLYIYLRT